MQQTKLIEALKTLDNREWNRFRAYVSSPFFNKNARAQKFLQILAQYAPAFESSKLEKKKVFKQLFPSDTYKEEKLRYEVWRLYSLLKDFFAYVELEADPWAKDIYYLSQLRKRNVQGLFDLQMKAISKSMDNASPGTSGLHYKKFLLADEANAFFYINQQVRSFNDSLQEKIDELNMNYISHKLRHEVGQQVESRDGNGKSGFRMEHEILSFLSKPGNTYRSHTDIDLWSKLYTLLEDWKNKQRFYDFLNFWSGHGNEFSEAEQYRIFIYLISYCQWHIDGGEREFLTQQFSLYREIVEKDLLAQGGKLGVDEFEEIVRVGLQQSDFDWVQRFIEGYKEKLPQSERNDLHTLSLAKLYTAQRHHQDAIELLELSNFSRPIHQIKGRHLLIQCYCEIGAWGEASYQIDTFSIFIKRSKVLKNGDKQAHLNYLKLLKKLDDFTQKLTSSQQAEILPHKEKFILQIQKSEYLIEKEWLLKLLSNIFKS